MAGTEELLARQVGSALKARGLTLAVAEGSTGGRLGEQLTRYSGSSRFFLGGVVTYDYRSRTELLDVPAALLERHGAVSESTAMAMAEGVRRRFASDVAVASTGIAGPSGGTPEKPVGMLWLAVAAPRATTAQRHVVESGTRLQNNREFTRLALQLLLDTVQALSGEANRAHGDDG